MFAKIEDALKDFREGKFVLVADDEARENEGDLIKAAQFVDAKSINFLAREARGLICVPMEGKRLDELQLGPMAQSNTDRHGTAYTMSVDARVGTTTGISAADRARAVQALIDPKTLPGDLMRPGHTFPLRAREGGVLVRAGHTEAAVDLCNLAGLYPAAVICEVLNEEGNSANLDELEVMAQQHDIKIITIEELIRYRRMNEKLVRRVAEAKLPTQWGEFRVVAYESVLDGTPFMALGERLHQTRRTDFSARSFGLFNRRCFRFIALRLRRPTARRLTANRGKRQRRFAVYRAARRARHRHFKQTARL